jgi:uncharacterized membrane protein YkoI
MNRRLKSLLVFLVVMVGGLHMAGKAWADDDNQSHGGDQHPSENHNGNNGEGESEDNSPNTGDTNSGAITAPNVAPITAPNANGKASQSAAFSRLPPLDPEQIKSAINSGKAVSMTMLLTFVKLNYPGDVLDVKLHETKNKLVYEVRYLSNVIFLRTVYLDAQTLKLL